MNLNLLVALVAFSLPGALALEVWDWSCHRRGRTWSSLLGHGIVVSLAAYGALQMVGIIDLASVLDEHGELSLHLLVRQQNVAALFGVTSALMLGAFVAGRWGHPRLAALLGRSFHETTWGAELEKATARDRTGVTWLTILTTTGWVWMGRPRRVPAAPDPTDFVALGQPRSFDHSTGRWRDETEPVVLLRVADIEHLYINTETERTHARTERPRSIREKGQLGGRPEPRPSQEGPSTPSTSSPGEASAFRVVDGSRRQRVR